MTEGKLNNRVDEVSGKLLHLVASSIKISSGVILSSFPNAAPTINKVHFILSF